MNQRIEKLKNAKKLVEKEDGENAALYQLVLSYILEEIPLNKYLTRFENFYYQIDNPSELIIDYMYYVSLVSNDKTELSDTEDYLIDEEKFRMQSIKFLESVIDDLKKGMI